ncbi:DUF2510 domain-containing protein, partial [Luteimicrobium xylanilyticum]|uniref:DUF2510 domain-containing protein n=1 Tax=Luteimicrobium xylanilyticum TaxID=1133546 RepID=UPI0031EBE770
MSNAQPGWYPDPHARGRMRWWDGVRWHHATRAEPELAPAPAEPGATRPGSAAPDATTQAIPLAPVMPSITAGSSARLTKPPATPSTPAPKPEPAASASDGAVPARRRRRAWWAVAAGGAAAGLVAGAR